jgi:hypothetical protein
MSLLYTIQSIGKLINRSWLISFRVALQTSEARQSSKVPL